MERFFYVIAYDITDNKRRARLVKAVEALGERVQYSVFELYLTPAELEKLVKRARKYIKESEDSVRIYNLCSACRGRAQYLGQGRATREPGLVIV